MTQTQTMPRTLARELPQHQGQTVKMQGFLHARRDLGGVQFLVLRDVSGITQCVGSGLHLPLTESSIEVTGTGSVMPSLTNIGSTRSAGCSRVSRTNRRTAGV